MFLVTLGEFISWAINSNVPFAKGKHTAPVFVAALVT